MQGSWSVRADGGFASGIHLVTGPVGSGKTTLALLLSGLEKPDVGCVVREGIRSVVLSLQFPEYQVTGTTPAEEIRSWGLPDEPVLIDCRLFMRRDDDIGTLSQGELKLLHLACVLARDDDLLILDEPFNMLDPPGKQWVCDRISSRTSGITIIMTHEQAFFPRVDLIWVMEGGVLGKVGPVPECLDKWPHIPQPIKRLLEHGVYPDTLRRQDLEAAACRIRE